MCTELVQYIDKMVHQDIGTAYWKLEQYTDKPVQCTEKCVQCNWLTKWYSTMYWQTGTAHWRSVTVYLQTSIVKWQNGTETKKKNWKLCSYISRAQWKILKLCWQICIICIVLKLKILKISNTTGLRLHVC